MPSNTLLTKAWQCDKIKPSCGQCLRAHLLCPGYHDPSTLIIRDSTLATILKSRSACARQFPPSTFPTLILSSPSRPLLPSVEVRAKTLFISHYVQGACAGAAPPFPYMATFWYKTRPLYPPLTGIVHATSLAYLAALHRSPEILERARRRYSGALRLTRDALEDLQTAVKDNRILLTVLLLALFEKLAGRVGVQSGGAERHAERHMNGALALVRFAGKKQFEDTMRVKMFHWLCMGILLGCLVGEREVPKGLLELRAFVEGSGEEWLLEEVMIRFIALRIEVRKGEIEEERVLREVRELDDELKRIYTSKLPKRWFEDVVRDRVSVEDLIEDWVDARLIDDPACATIHQIFR